MLRLRWRPPRPAPSTCMVLTATRRPYVMRRRASAHAQRGAWQVGRGPACTHTCAARLAAHQPTAAACRHAIHIIIRYIMWSAVGCRWQLASRSRRERRQTRGWRQARVAAGQARPRTAAEAPGSAPGTCPRSRAHTRPRPERRTAPPAAVQRGSTAGGSGGGGGGGGGEAQRGRRHYRHPAGGGVRGGKAPGSFTCVLWQPALPLRPPCTRWHPRCLPAYPLGSSPPLPQAPWPHSFASPLPCPPLAPPPFHAGTALLSPPPPAAARSRAGCAQRQQGRGAGRVPMGRAEERRAAAPGSPRPTGGRGARRPAGGTRASAPPPLRPRPGGARCDRATCHRPPRPTRRPRQCCWGGARYQRQHPGRRRRRGCRPGLLRDRGPSARLQQEAGRRATAMAAAWRRLWHARTQPAVGGGQSMHAWW